MTAPAAKLHVELQSRLEKTLLALDFVEQLRHESLGPVSRALNRVRDSLPLSAIPAVAAWTLLSMLMPAAPERTLGAYFIGLFLILACCLMLVLATAVLNRRRVADVVLARIAEHIDGLAYHPNHVLKQQLASQGYITQAQLLVWVAQQRTILQTRARDLRARRRGVEVKVPTEVAGEGARRFLRC